MIVLVSSHTSWRTHYLAGRWGGVGLLLSPDSTRTPFPHLPWALDNGAFSAFKNDQPFDGAKFRKALAWAESQVIAPEWVVVPDKVLDMTATFSLWHDWAPAIRGEKAFAVQDGMVPSDLALEGVEPDVIFVGGSPAWKRKSLPSWVNHHPRVHVGQINSGAGLQFCSALGAESVDGTGFFRGDRRQLSALMAFLAQQANPERPIPTMYPDRQIPLSLEGGK